MTKQLDPDRMLPSEALVSFVAWLTTRREATVMGAAHDSAGPAALVRDWLAVNELREPREHFHKIEVRQPEYPEGAPEADGSGRMNELLESVEDAWCVIANASDWDAPESAEWREAAERWRDRYNSKAASVPVTLADMPQGAPEAVRELRGGTGRQGTCLPNECDPECPGEVAE